MLLCDGSFVGFVPCSRVCMFAVLLVCMCFLYMCVRLFARACGACCVVGYFVDYLFVWCLRVCASVCECMCLCASV